MYYIDMPDATVINNWIQAGHRGADLFEPIGGGHPSQTQRYFFSEHYSLDINNNDNNSILWAEAIWDTLLAKYPHILGPVNPYNAQITAMFGNQGGY